MSSACNPRAQVQGPEPQVSRAPRLEALQKGGVLLEKAKSGEGVAVGWVHVCAFPLIPLICHHAL